MSILTPPLSKRGILKALGQDPSKSDVLTVSTNSSGGVDLLDPRDGTALTPDDFGWTMSGSAAPKKAISFIFDDGYTSARDVVGTLFESRGLRLGAAINQNAWGNNGLQLADLVDFGRTGHEILNHAVTGDGQTAVAYGIARLRAEIATMWSVQASIGYTPRGYVTPSSLMGTQYVKEAAAYCDYAFTLAEKTDRITASTDPYKLWRCSLLTKTQPELLAIVADIAANGGGAVFYEHDVAAGSDVYNKTVALLDAAAAAGIPVLPPHAALREIGVRMQGAPLRWYRGELLSSDPTPANWTVNNAATLSLSNVFDLYVNFTQAGITTVERTFLLDQTKIEAQELLTFSAGCRITASAMNYQNGIGIQMLNNSNTVLSEKSITGQNSHTNGGYPRWNISCNVMPGTTKVRVWMTLDGLAATKVLLRNPVLAKGTDVSQRQTIAA